MQSNSKFYLFYSLLIISIFIISACTNATNSKKAENNNITENILKKGKLTWGDATWDPAPFDKPGGEGEQSDSNNSNYGADLTEAASDYNGSSNNDWEEGRNSQNNSCPEPEVCEEQTYCDEEQEFITNCEIIEDPQNSNCLIKEISTVVCPEGTQCEDRSGEISCFEKEEEKESEEIECKAEGEPVILYMSADDSNSQASPVLSRSNIMNGGTVNPNQVRIYEFLNYYDMSYENPEDKPAEVGIQMRRTNADQGVFTLLLFAQGKKIEPGNRRPLNIVFSLDTSGSMSGTPMEMLKEVVIQTAAVLNEGDVISLVEWSNSQNVILDSYNVQSPNDPSLLEIAGKLTPGGGTDLHGGLVKAYELAQKNYSEDRINRVMIISDGGANVGVTDIDLIADKANDENAEGIYMVGVGVGDGIGSGYYGYRDDLMNHVTDAGKGAYIFIDTKEEAIKMFGDPKRFLANFEVAARDVKMELTMPSYFAMKEFHGEEYSADPEEVEAQHLSPNDAMSYHQTVQVCDNELVMAEHMIKAKATFKDPITREEMTDEIEISIGQLVENEASQLRKGDVIVSYAESLIMIGYLLQNNAKDDAAGVALNMKEWLTQAANELNDPDITELVTIMTKYSQTLNNTDTEETNNYSNNMMY